MLRYKVEKMSCGHCVQTIANAVTSVDPTATVTADLASRTIAIETATPAADMSAILARAGYATQPL
jgi:copper chaperone